MDDLADASVCTVSGLPYMFPSPLVWLCITREFVVSGVLFGLATAAMIAMSAAEPMLYEQAVETIGWVPGMSSTWLRWHYCFNLIQLETLVFGMVGYLLRELAPQLKAYVEVQARMDEVARKVLELDLDDIAEPGPTAMELEKSLFMVVVRMREWKPYIPSTAFLTLIDNVSEAGSGDRDRGVLNPPLGTARTAASSFIGKKNSHTVMTVTDTDSVQSFPGQAGTTSGSPEGPLMVSEAGSQSFTESSKRCVKSGPVVQGESSSCANTDRSKGQPTSDSYASLSQPGAPRLFSRSTTLAVIHVAKLLSPGKFVKWFGDEGRGVSFPLVPAAVVLCKGQGV